MVMCGYIAHYQAHTIFPKGYQGKFLPITCATPIGRVGSTVQNLALKSQIFLPNKSLRRLFFFCGRLWGMRSAEKNRFTIEILCPRIDCKQFFADFSVIWFSAELHYTNCVPDFCWKTDQRNLVFRPLPGRNSSFVLYSGLLLIQCLDLGFLLKIFFRRNSTSQNVRLSSADLVFFRRKSINLVMHDYPWFPAAFSFPNVKFCLYQPQWQINWSRI